MKSSGPRAERLECEGRIFLEVHQEECVTALAEGGEKLEILIAQLHNRASDERHLFDAWRVYAEWEREHPGTTAFALVAGIDFADMRRAIKLFQRLMRNREFCPEDDDHELRIELAPVEDQLIPFATFQILEPLVVPTLDPRTVSATESRIRRSDLALSLSGKKKRFVWVTASVGRPYDHVQRVLLLDLFWGEFPNRKMILMLEDLIETSAKTGIRTPSRLADLLLDFYLDRAVLREWRKAHPQVPLIRCAGNFLMLCKTRKDAKKLFADLKTLLGKTGMELQKPEGKPINNLSLGEKAAWQGFEITREDDAWDVAVAESK